MNEFLKRNIDALASITTLFVTFFGYSDDKRIVEAAALACKSAALEWYEKNGIEFDMTIEDFCHDALEYAGMKLLEIKKLAEFTAKMRALREE